MIERTTLIDAPAQICFDLARDVDDHVTCMSSTCERVVAGKTTGLLELGDTMTLEARHLGFKFRLTARITEMDEHSRFVDEMDSGPFRSLRHEHAFIEREGVTCLTDVMEVEAPFWLLGRLAEHLIVKRLLTSVIEKRQSHIKRKAEELAQKNSSLEPSTL